MEKMLYLCCLFWYEKVTNREKSFQTAQICFQTAQKYVILFVSLQRERQESVVRKLNN